MTMMMMTMFGMKKKKYMSDSDDDEDDKTNKRRRKQYGMGGHDSSPKKGYDSAMDDSDGDKKIPAKSNERLPGKLDD